MQNKRRRWTILPQVVAAMMPLLAGCALFRGADSGQITLWPSYAASGPKSEDKVAYAAEVLRRGDTGLGHLSPVDGELVFENGSIFQIRADGNVHQPPLTARIGAALICPFRLDIAIRMVGGTGVDDLRQELIGQAKGEIKAPLVFRLHGRFDSIKASAIGRRRLIGGGARKFDLQRVSGIITGFYLPETAPGLHDPGLHMVFLSHDRMSGGRVEDFTLLDGTLEIHLPDRLLVIYPR